MPRLSKDREKSVRSSEVFFKLAMVHLMLNWLEPPGKEAVFHHRRTARPGLMGQSLTQADRLEAAMGLAYIGERRVRTVAHVPW